LAEHRIVLQECDGCGRRRFPRLPACPYCGRPGGRDVDVPGTGEVYSFVRAQRALTPAFVAEVPYSVATIALDGGGRIVGRAVPPDRVAIGVRVGPQFVDHETWTELQFHVV
jgi:uncharacterized OB-fold protein